jgi:hypothetical protein
MLNVNFSQLDIVGSVLIEPGATATAPDGYSFVMLCAATSNYLDIGVTGTTGLSAANIYFTNLVPLTGTSFFGVGVTGSTGISGSSSNFSISRNSNQPLIGRWRIVRPATYGVIAYLAR